MPSEADIILFCIRATLRINEQFRHAYADSTRSRTITLPLPIFPAAVDRSSMESFYRFGVGKDFVDTNLRVRQHLKKLSDIGDLSPEEDQELNQIFAELNAMV